MEVLQLTAYVLIGIAGLAVWIAIVHLLTNWKKPWQRILSVTVLCIGVGILTSVATVTVTETRAIRTGEGTEQNPPTKPVQHNAGSRPSSNDSTASETPSSLGLRG